MFENIFETVNSGFAQALYEDYLRDPESVPPEWRELFENGVRGEEPVERHAREREDEGEGDGAEAARPRGAVAAAPPPPDDGSVEAVKGPALRLLQNMEASLAVPTATSFRDLDVSRLWAQRAAFNQQLKSEGKKLSFTHFIGWAIVLATRDFPVMVHTLREDDGEYYRVDPGHVNLGLAVDVEGKDGERKLLVPVIKHADEMSFREFYKEYERLVAGARDGKLMPDAYMGGTITLTNPGTIGTVASVPRLMHNQGSIIATGAIRDVTGNRIMTMTSTYDHRIIQGAESGLFLQRVEALLRGEEGFYRTIAREMDVDGSAVEAAAAVAAATAPTVPVPAATPAGAEMGLESAYHIAAAMSLVKNHRTHGYLAARLDPLGTEPIGDPALEPEPLGLTPEIQHRVPADVLRVYVHGETLADVLPRLREIYCGTIAYEIEHIASHEQRVWLRRVIESGEHRRALTDDEKRRLLSELSKVEGLETFLHRNYLGQKRFSIEGLDMLVPMLHQALEQGAEQGTKEAVLGMAHRGRLNVLAHILDVPYREVLRGFEGGQDIDTLITRGHTGDVKYHHGASGVYRTLTGEELEVSLPPNPSHLEAVDPVVEGGARAQQTDRSSSDPTHDPRCVLPILIHGDAAFAAQGVVAETLNLARLAGYGTGGTLHILANNQIGFTTNPQEARSTDFASDLAKGFDVPIVHVNADDPDACLAAVRVAMWYREKFANDFVINLVGYRRYGHNEGDEPRYTQPTMYELVDAHPTVRTLYANHLIEQEVMRAEEAEQEMERVQETLRSAQDELQAGEDDNETEADRPARAEDDPSRKSGLWAAAHEPETGVTEETLRRLNEELLSAPDGFNVNRKLKRLLDRHRKALDEKGKIDWPHGEMLAFASLLVEGVPLRLTGQDSVRGTFSQRHLTLFDEEDGTPYTPIHHLSEATAPFELHNSPLSEYAVMGFEYGYSVAAPETLVMWEAQFGDFVNGGEVIVDQFVIAGLSKWGQTSRLTLLLPHGYEGQGPEHSSARLERFLALGAENNIRVANCSTPAQYFHLLRRQAKHEELRPLIIMTPKSLLRLPQATSSLEDFVDGRFRYVLDDPDLSDDREAVKRLVLCTGKVFYDVMTSEERSAASHVAVGRIELLYPFPVNEVAELIGAYPNLEEILWLQEEPNNMGARKFVVPQIAHLMPDGVSIRSVARPERASPAEGFPAAHKAEQARLVAEALS